MHKHRFDISADMYSLAAPTLPTMTTLDEWSRTYVGKHRSSTVSLAKPVSLAKRVTPNVDTLIRSGL